jgi:hypothetical protein
VVPVAGFWSDRREISLSDLRAAIDGESVRWPVVIGERALVGALAAMLDVTPSGSFVPGDTAAVSQRLALDPSALGILAAPDVSPAVRALTLDGRSLFGTQRVASLADWPLVVSAAPHRPRFDPAAQWTLVAGGDVMLDREVYRQTLLLGGGIDLPWDGGTARISDWRCCNSLGNRLPVAERTGNDGAVRDLLQAADVSLVNLEGPAVEDFRYHPEGLVFTFDPDLLAGLRSAGIDLVDLANNHIGNAGPAGIIETVEHLGRLGIAHVGAGEDLTAAHAPALLGAGGLEVALLGYDAIHDPYEATAFKAGNARLVVENVRADIAAARRGGANVVIVLAHWGVEYRATPTSAQRSAAKAILAAGADLIIGSHSHWAGAIGASGASLVFYSLGDLVFDLARSEETLEGMLIEITFSGTRMVQVALHPTLIVDLVQPNLLDPPDAKAVLERMRKASAATLQW